MATFEHFYKTLRSDDKVKWKDFEKFVKWYLKTDPRFARSIIELHCIGNHGDRGGGDQGPIKDPFIKLQCMEKLNKYHDLIHISPTKILGKV